MTIRKLYAFYAAILIFPVTMLAQWEWDEEAHAMPSQVFFDEVLESRLQARLAFIGESQFHGHGKSSIIEMDSQWLFAYLSKVLGGELEGRLLFGAKFFSNSADLEIPNQLVALAVRLGWTWQYINDFALQARVDPGIYSDIENISSDAIFLPFSLALEKSFSPGFSGVAGLIVRPNFALVVMPIIGVHWDINNWAQLKAQIPESRFVYYVTSRWTTYAGFDWENITYALEEHGIFNSEKITLDSLRYFGGMSYRINDGAHLGFEVGEVFDREVEFDDIPEGYASRFKIDNGFFFRASISGTF